MKRVRLVRRALEIGFTLEELARILRVRDSGGAPCREVRSFAVIKLDQIDERIADLCNLRDHMRRVLADWDQRLASAPKGARAGLLDALMTVPFPKGTPAMIRFPIAFLLLASCAAYAQDVSLILTPPSTHAAT